MANEDNGCCGCLILLAGALVLGSCVNNYIDNRVRERVREQQPRQIVENHFYAVSTNGVPIEVVKPYR